MKRLALAAVLAGLAGCIVNMGTSTTGTAPPPKVPLPDKFTGPAAPELVDVGVDGCKQAPSLDPNLYYCARDEHWFRYAMNRWYLAFEWDGNWFPTGGSELPRSLAAITPKPAEVQKSREERLKELDEKMKALDEQEKSQGGH
ncbi:MAG TPA: hypothetical protein VMR31_01515 [Myxococcota bacterium]|nr:hypothetical protein [Myxococcota bacterium]